MAEMVSNTVGTFCADADFLYYKLGVCGCVRARKQARACVCVSYLCDWLAEVNCAKSGFLHRKLATNVSADTGVCYHGEMQRW